MKFKGSVYRYIQITILLEILSNFFNMNEFICKDNHSVIIEVP